MAVEVHGPAFTCATHLLHSRRSVIVNLFLCMPWETFRTQGTFLDESKEGRDISAKQNYATATACNEDDDDD